MPVPTLPRDAPGLAALRSAVDAMDALVTILDPTGRVVHVNRAWHVLAATGDAGTDPVALATGYADDPTSAVATGVRDVVEGRRERFEAEVRRGAPGRPRWLALRATPIAVDGVGAIVVHTDVTARRAAERATTHAEDHDGTTGLANRRLLEHALGELLTDRPVGVLALRLHAADDAAGAGAPTTDEEALRETAALLGRLVDADAVAGRYGADVFVVLLPGTDEDALHRVAMPLRAGWHARMGRRPDLELAVGSMRAAPGEDPHDVLVRAAATTRADPAAGSREAGREHPATREPQPARVREPHRGIPGLPLRALGRHRPTLPQS